MRTQGCTEATTTSTTKPLTQRNEGRTKLRRTLARSGGLALSLFAVLCTVAGVAADAQTARLAGQITNFGSTLTNAVGIAADGAQNAYVVTSTGSVYKETYSSTTSTYTENFLFTTASGSGSDIAVDTGGDTLYVGTGTGHSVAQYTGSGTSYALGTTFTGFNGNTAPALDTAGNVYIVDTGSTVLYKETLSGSTFTQASIATGFNAPNSLAVDATGNIFVVSGTANNTVYKVAGSGTSYTKTTLALGTLTGITGVSVDANDDLFLQANTEVYEAVLNGSTYTNGFFYQYTGSALALDNQGNVYLVSTTQTSGTKITVGAGYLNFGSVGPGTPPTMTIAFTLTSTSTTALGTPTVVTQGLTGYDFSLASGGTCAGAASVAGSSCTVNVQFSPQASGSRLGAVNLIAGSKTIAYSYLGGTGFTPVAVYQSVTYQNTISNSLNNGRGITVDPAGNVWVANSTSSQILKFPAGSTTPVAFNTTSTCQPVGTAIDGEGNVFYTCNNETNMYELVGGANPSVAIPISYNGTGYATDDHLSVDAAGNLYPTSYKPVTNLFFKVAVGTHTVSLIATAPSGARFVGAVTDAAGNTFAPDYNNNILYELPAGSNTLTTLYSGAPLQAPHAIAEDAAGSLYVTTTVPGTSGSGNSPLLRFSAGNYTATPASLSVPGGDSLWITPNGTFYTVYSNATLAVYNRTSFALDYSTPQTPVGQTSASQTVTLENDGTAPLTISPPTSGTNPSISPNFTYDPASTCNPLTASSAPIMLAAGASCTQIIEFAPTQAGSQTGQVKTTDNSANVPGSVQLINLTASASQGTPTVTVSNVSGTLGQNATLTATVTGGGTVPTGGLTFVVGSGASVTATCTTGSTADTCTASYPTSTALAAGANTITATYAGDTNYLSATGTGTLTLAPAPTTSSVASSLNPSTYGQSVTFNATVTSTYGTPSGVVTFYDGTTALGTVSLSATGTASLSTNSLSVATHPITISYGGASNFATSTSSPVLNQVVNKAPVTTTDTVTGSGNYGATTTPVTVTIPYVGVVAPTGLITVKDGFANTVTIQASNCTAAAGKLTCTGNLPTANEPVNATGNALTVTQAADASYSGSSGTGSVIIAKALATTTDTAAGTGFYGATTTPVTVTIPYAGTAAPTGQITLTDGYSETLTFAASTCTAAAGKLTCTPNFPTAAEPVSATGNTVNISQAGDNNYSGSTGTGLIVIGKAAATATDTATGSGTYGAPSTPVTVTIPYSGTVAPTGAITVSDGYTNTVTVAASTCTAASNKLTCTITLPTANEPVSSTGNTVNISQAGDSNYSGSTGTGLVIIAKAAATTTDTATGSGTYGAATTPVTVTIPYSGSTAPTGQITLTDGYSESISFAASTCTAASSKLTCTTNLPTAKEPVSSTGNTVNVSQAADSNYSGSTGSGLVIIAKAAATTTDTATGSGTYGAAATPVTVTIPYGGTAAPTGAVAISDSFSNTVTVQASACTAASNKLTCTISFPTASEPVSATGNTVSISQAADGNYSGSTGTGLVTISKAAATTNDTATGSGTYGAATTPVTVTIPFVGAAAPTGLITVTDTYGESVTIQASACTAAAGKLTCTGNLPTASEPLSSTGNTVNISQAADANYSGSTGTGLVTIGKAAATTNDTATGAGTYGAATTPVTITIPYTGSTAPAGAITLSDTFGNTVTVQTSACTAASSKLTCTANLPTASEPVSATGNTVNISQAADANYSGSTGTGLVTIAKAAATATDTATGSGTYGAATTPVTVTIPYVGATAPTGSITVTDTFSETVTVQASACTAAGNKLTCIANLPTAAEPVSSTGNSVTVAQAADANYSGSTGSGLVTIAKAAATTNDTASGSGIYGAATTPVTVTIPYAGAVAPTGSITLTDGYSESVTLQASACTAAAGKLTCTANLPTAKEPVNATGNPVTVSQAADSNYSGSTGTGAVIISKAAATTGDTATGAGTYGAATTPITITIPYAGSTAPTGLITVSDNFGENVVLQASNCTATAGKLICAANLPTAAEPLSSTGNALAVSQATDSNYSGSTGTGSVTIGKAAATTGDTATGSGTYGAATTPITVTIPYAGTAAPTGQITVADGFGNTLNLQASACTAASGKLTCTGNMPTANEPINATGNPVTVSQAADSNYSGSTGTGAIIIAKAAATTGDTATGSGTFGAATTPVTVTIPYVGAVAPTGQITLTDGFGESASVAAASCSAAGGKLTCIVNMPTAAEPVSATGNPVSIAQAADSNYAGSTGTGAILIGKAAATTGDTATGAGTYGAATTAVSVTIPYAGTIAPTGAITVADNFSNTVTVAASTCTAAAGKLTCTVNLPTASEPVSSTGNQVTVSQAGDSNYNGSTGTGLVTISKAATTANDSATGAGTFGAATTPVTITIPYVGSVAPTGTITLTDTYSETVSVQASGCTAASGKLTCTTNLPTAKEPVSSTGNQVNITQAADGNYSGSTGTGLVTIGRAPGTSGDSATGTGTYGVPTTPVTVTIPYAASVAPTGAVTVSDNFNNSITVAASTCTVGSGKLTCTVNLPTATEPVSASGNALTVAQAGDSNYSGSTGNGAVVIGKALATTNDSATGTGSYGAPKTPVTITIPYAGTAAPTGAITLTDTYNNTVTIAASSCTAATGKLTCTADLPTANEPFGANPVSVSQAGDSNYTGSTGTGTVTIGKAAATTGDTATGTGVYGAPTTSVKVTLPFTGTTAPTGAVTLTDTHNNTVTVAASTCTTSGSALNCTANLPTANEPVGGNLVEVSQAADADYAGSSGSGTVTIGKAPATSTDTATGSGTYGAATTPVTVNIPFAGTAAPTGTVTVKDSLGNTASVAESSCSASSNVLSCTVNLATANEPVGANTVTVSQSGDGNYTGSTGTGTVTIGKASATATDTANGTGTYGAATTTVVVSIPYAGVTAPTGAITVADSFSNTITIPASSCVSSGGALTCTANMPTANEPVGSNPVTVSQAADANYSGSTGTGSITINPAGAHGGDSANGTGTYGSPATPITVVIPFSGATAPTGAISVADSLGNTVTIAASACTASSSALVCPASLPTANEPVGSNPVSVAQAADANHAASTGSGAININKAAATSSDSANGSGTYGASTTPVTVTIPYAGVTAPAGALTVTDSLGETATVQASTCTAASQTLTCTVNLPTANEPLGSNQISVAQAADNNYTGSTGTGTVTITASTVSPVGNTASGVQNVTITQGTASTLLTATLAYGGSVPPSGALTFTVGSGSPVTATCSAGPSPETCTAFYPTGSFQVGTYTITATEAADANYAAGSATATLTVAQGSVSPILDSVSYVGNVLIAAGTPSAAMTANITYTGPVPTGGLTFNLPGGTPVAATCTSGPSPLTCNATYPTASLAAGTYVITAVEAADSNYPQGTATSLLTVSPTATSPVSPILTTGSYVSSVLVPYGTPMATLNATIVFNGPAPTGQVTFSVVGGTGVSVQGVCTSGSSPMTCTADYPTGTLGIGSYEIQVNVAADANYPAGNAIGTLTVSEVSPGTKDAVTGTGTYGAPTTPISVTIPYPGAAAPTGAVSVTDSFGNTVTIPASACTAGSGTLTCPANLSTANVPVGTDAATVSQGMDAIYAASTGSGSITIGKALSTSNDTATGTGVYGAATTPVTISIPYAGTVAPSGAITLADGFGNTVSVAASSCTASAGTLSCVANLNTASEPLGSNPVTVSQAGDANYSGSNGAGTVTIDKAGATNGDTASGTGTYGAATTPVIVTIPYAGSVAPSGAITVADTHGNSVAVAASACSAAARSLTCTATLPTATEPTGANMVTVTQAADANYGGSTGTGTVTINKAAATTGDSATGTGTYGAPTTTITITVPYVGTTAPSGAITVTDSLGNTVTVAASACTAASGVLTCTATLPTANEPVGANTLTVTQAADSNYSGSTGTGTLTVGKAAATATDTATGNGTYGAPSSPVTVTIPYAGAAAPTGTITVADSHGNTVTVAASTCAAANGTLTCNTTLASAVDPLGANSLTVTEAGDTNYTGSTGTGTLTISKAAATTGDTATGTGSYGGSTTTVIVKIPFTGSVAPTGAITVADTLGNTVTVAASTCTSSAGVLTCTASLPTADEPIGSNTVTVGQAADANYSGSTGTGTLILGKAAATTTDTATGTGTYGAATTAVTVSIPYAGTAAPTGAVTVTDSLNETVTVPATACTAVSGVLTCTANLPTASEPVGSNPVTVSQAGDSNYTGSTGSGTVTINKAGSSADTATGTGIYGNPSTAVTISIPYTGAIAPTGAITLADTLGNTVTVQASACSAASGVLTCPATLPTANEPVGANAVTVNQAADVNHNASTGTGTITLGKAAATTTDKATGTGAYGAPTTTVNVTIPFAGTAAPTGAVTVADAFNNTATIPGGSCTAAGNVLSCVLTLATANEPVGSNPVTVTQAGDANYTGSTGSGSVTINKAAAGNDTATGSGTYGAPSTAVTISIPYTGSIAPTGTVILADTHGNTVTVQASACTAAAGVLTCPASLATANEPVGSNPVSINQAADTNHSASAGSGTVTITKAAATTTDTATGIGTYGTATTAVTVSIPYAGTAAPTGAVTVTDSFNETVTVPATGCSAAAGVLTCTANLPTLNEPVGANPVIVAQAGDANYIGSTGTGTVTVNKATAGNDSATGTGTYGAATTPVTVTIPYAGTAPTGAITLSDTHGNTVTVSGCTASSGTLTCTANLPTGNEPVGANPVTVNQAADASHNASTGTGTVTVNKAAATSNDSVTGTGTYGAATTAVTVSIPYAGAAAPTGAITIADILGNTLTVPASGCTANAGVLTCTASLPTANEVLGTNALTITQAPDANYSGSTGTGSITMGKAAATTGDTATGTGTYGAATTPVTVTIPFVGTTAPTGVITITDTYSNTVAVLASTCTASKTTLTCTATMPTASEPAGINAVTVSQAADANFGGSTGNGSITLAKAAATSADTVTGTGTYGGASTSVTVTIPYAGAAAPTGAITVTDKLGNTVTVAASSCTAAKGTLTCTATLPTANEPAGTNTVTVTQAADANYSGSTGTGAVTIGKSSPTLTAPAVSPLNAAVGTSVTLTQTVPSAETGTVTFSNGTTVLGTATISNGVATLTTSALPLGTDTITATANGDSNYSAATSPAVTDNVGGGAAQIALTASRSTSSLGSPVTFTANVTSTTGITVAGTVTFYDGTSALGTVPATNGTASLSTSALTAGPHAITATFTPATGSALSAVTSAPLTETVMQAASMITLTSSLNPAIVGQSITFSATVPTTLTGVAPTGTVTFYDGTTSLGSASLNGSGVATYTSATLKGGVHSISASYAGNASYANSTSAAVSQQVSDFTVGSTTPTIAVDPGKTAAFNITINSLSGVSFGAPVTLTVTGLPANYTPGFTPGIVTPGANGASSTMTVLTMVNVTAQLERQQQIKRYEAAAMWACLFPLLGLSRVRRRIPKALLSVLLCLASFGVIAPLTGCSGGYFGPAPATYTLTVTGTSGTLQRSTTVTLTVH